MIKDLVLKNRSYRAFNQDRKVTKEELMDMVDCARFTASTVNIQPLKYYLAWEQDEVAKIQKLTKWAKALKDIVLPHEGQCPTAFIVVMQDKNLDGNLMRFQKDCGIVAHTILLRAVEMGLGGCMIGSFHAEEVSNALHLPEEYAPLLVIAIGQPAEEIILEDIKEDGDHHYYRDEKDGHHVPKRKLDDIIMIRE